MKQLLELNDRHPVATGAVGILSGLGTWLLDAIHAVAQPIADLGLIAGGLTALLVLAVKIRALLRDHRARRWRRRVNARAEPFEEGRHDSLDFD